MPKKDLQSEIRALQRWKSWTEVSYKAKKSATSLASNSIMIFRIQICRAKLSPSLRAQNLATKELVISMFLEKLLSQVTL